MRELNKHITFEEVKELLDNPRTNEQTIEQLKVLAAEEDSVKGLIDFLAKNNWDYGKVKERENRAHQEFEQLIPQHKKLTNNWLKMAAVLVPLIGIGAVLYIMFFTPSQNDMFYAKYAIKENGLPTLMNENSKKHFDESMAAFKDEAYEEALMGFEQLMENQAQNDTLHYFVACSNLALNNIDEAITHFEKVNSNSVFKEAAEYRLALSWLKNNEIQKAKEELKKITENSKHDYHSKASQLLREPAFQ